jgi:predicted nucleic acid-binding protein
MGLDRGEAEVLALAEEREARLVVIDERKARRYAQRLGIPLTGTLGLLVAAKERA